MGIFAFLVTFYAQADQTVGLVFKSFKIHDSTKTDIFSKKLMNKRITQEDINLLKT
jgi:hypothetical protein